LLEVQIWIFCRSSESYGLQISIDILIAKSGCPFKFIEYLLED